MAALCSVCHARSIRRDTGGICWKRMTEASPLRRCCCLQWSASSCCMSRACIDTNTGHYCVIHSVQNFLNGWYGGKSFQLQVSTERDYLLFSSDPDFKPSRLLKCILGLCQNQLKDGSNHDHLGLYIQRSSLHGRHGPSTASPKSAAPNRPRKAAIQQDEDLLDSSASQLVPRNLTIGSPEVQT